MKAAIEMREHILISPLGFSPGAVSGAAFGLQRQLEKENEANKVSRVITLGTSHPRVIEAAGYIAPLFAQANIAYQPEVIPQSELRQHDESAATFVARMGSILESAGEMGAVVHVAITGGRSGMGALAALATSLYGADHLWHLWVEEEIELKGRIGSLPQPFDMNNIYLNPPPEKYELVELPFLNMRPLHPFLWDYYRYETFTTESSLVASLLQGNFINTKGIKLSDIFPSGATLYHKRQVEEMVLAPEKRSREQQKQLVRILEQAGQLDKSDGERLLQILALNFPSSEVLGLAEYQEINAEFWQYLQSQEEVIRRIVASGKRPISRSQLLRNLDQSFSEEEFKTFCFELNVPYKNLGGEGTIDKMRELMGFMERRGRLPELVVFADKKRPHLKWFEDGDGVINETIVTEGDLFLMYGLQLWLNYRGL